MLRDVVLSRSQMARACDQSRDEKCTALVLMRVDTLMLAFNIDADELDHCKWYMDARGRRWSFDSSSRYAVNPIVLLSAWEYPELKRILRALRSVNPW